MKAPRLRTSTIVDFFRGNAMPTFLATLLLAGCGTPKIGGFKQEDLRRWYVPGEGTSRPSVAYERVAYLDAPPTDRKYRVIGYVAPPSRRFHSPGELLNAIRAAASLYGGDAVFVDNQKELEG